MQRILGLSLLLAGFCSVAQGQEGMNQATAKMSIQARHQAIKSHFFAATPIANRLQVPAVQRVIAVTDYEKEQLERLAYKYFQPEKNYTPYSTFSSQRRTDFPVYPAQKIEGDIKKLLGKPRYHRLCQITLQVQYSSKERIFNGIARDRDQTMLPRLITDQERQAVKKLYQNYLLAAQSLQKQVYRDRKNGVQLLAEFEHKWRKKKEDLIGQSIYKKFRVATGENILHHKK